MAKISKKQLKNPFVYQGYVSPDYFCDRTEETEELIANLQNGRNTVLISPRRIGKTGLIKNAFYRLNLRQALNDKYHFDINSLDSYKKGIEFKSVNQIYIAIGAAAGTLAVGGILKYSLSRNVNVPFAVIIAGAVAAACISIFYVVPEKNKTRFRHAVHMFLNELESDVVTWIEEVERFFDSQVKTLYNEQE